MTSMRARLGSMTAEQRIQTLLHDIGDSPGKRFYSNFMLSQVQFRSFTQHSPNTALVTFAFPVDEYYSNNSGAMHGGFQSTAFDNLTSLAIIAAVPAGSAWLDGGVSRVLTVNYLRPASLGEWLVCECEVTHVGKRMAMTRGVLKRERDGAVVSTCEHNKSVVEGGKPGFGPPEKL